MAYDEEGFQAWVPDAAIEALTLRRALAQVEDPTTMATEIFKENLPLAAMSLVHMAVHSQSEPMRFQASKLVVERMMGLTTRQDTKAGERPIWEEIYNEVVKIKTKELPSS